MTANRLNPYVLEDCKTRWGLTTDTRLADRLGIDPRTLKDYREGIREPSVKVLVKLRALTGWPLDGLVLETASQDAA
ncbi:MAG: helix-turn-helix domain-containing protein [Corynebacterium sp.]|uniref:helix-turn-helix domain-containing protein n=1 Tax=Corynebacterium TaxID=1716 RepID=UPI003F0C3E07